MTPVPEGFEFLELRSNYLDTVGPFFESPKMILDTRGHAVSEKLHIVERFTRTDATHMNYEVTIEDPKAYTRPWTMAWALVREMRPGFELLEEACWEGERALPTSRKQGLRVYFGDTWRSR